MKKDKTLNSISSLCLLSVSAQEWVSGMAPTPPCWWDHFSPLDCVLISKCRGGRGVMCPQQARSHLGPRVYLSREAGYQALAFLSAFGLLPFSQLAPSFPFGIPGNQATRPPPSSTVTHLTLTHWTAARRRTNPSSKVEIFTLLFPDEKDGWQGLGWETAV